MLVNRVPLKLIPDPSRVILRFLNLGRNERVESLVRKVLTLLDEEVNQILNEVVEEFEQRHPYFDKASKEFESGHSYFKNALIRHFKRVEEFIPEDAPLSENRKYLIGAYFTKEYSIESAALFNPSIVPHPDQTNLEPGSLRYILSLRAIGEGHISSIEFRTGTIKKNNQIHLKKCTQYAVQARGKVKIFTKAFLEPRVKYIDDFDNDTLEIIPDEFSKKEIIETLANAENDSFTPGSIISGLKSMVDILDANYDIKFHNHSPISERVIFPRSRSESMGMEDVRFVRFEDNGQSHFFGTYTAYNGSEIKSQFIETDDFVNFKIRTLHGEAVNDKGMALFPRKINGKYAMISRQGSEEISIMFSNNLHFWEEYQTLEVPLKHWKFVQIGNCGSPVETKEGWILLTHAVGPLRKYVISACLLDLNDPSLVLSSLDEPLMTPGPEEREGYVPNVLYTCGLIAHNQQLIIPYAMSDSATGFATISVRSLLDRLIANINNTCK